MKEHVLFKREIITKKQKYIDRIKKIFFGRSYGYFVDHVASSTCTNDLAILLLYLNEYTMNIPAYFKYRFDK